MIASADIVSRWEYESICNNSVEVLQIQVPTPDLESPESYIRGHVVEDNL